MSRAVRVGSIPIGGRHPLVLMAGPCVIETRRACVALAGKLVGLAADERIPLIFKASYDKANRSSVGSFRGPGIQSGLDVLREIKERFGVPVLTDVHSVPEVELVAEVADVLQLPAFLCRQTDLILALGHCGKPVNIKKGQFLAPGDMVGVVGKIESTGNRHILLTERGTSFGYNNLVVDMRSLPIMAQTGYPVIFDATHSVQLPGGAGDRSSGDRRLAPYLARAAVAAGCNAVFLETYVNPDKAPCDADNALAFRSIRTLWKTLRDIHALVTQGASQ